MAFTLVVSRSKSKLCVGNSSVVKRYIIRYRLRHSNYDMLISIGVDLIKIDQNTQKFNHFTVFNFTVFNLYAKLLTNSDAFLSVYIMSKDFF